MNTRNSIIQACNDVRDLLLEKNQKYGNSALDPLRVFSTASPVEQLMVRVDDKLSRIKTSGLSGIDEDTLQDLIGYLVLLKVAVTTDEPQQGDPLPFTDEQLDAWEDANRDKVRSRNDLYADLLLGDPGDLSWLPGSDEN